MPAEFLTQHQKRRYGRYAGEPTPEQLARYFHLDDADLQNIRNIQGKSNRFGFAVQLCTVRFLGVFPAQFREIPRNVLDFIAVQLNVRKIERLSKYSEKSTRWRHAETIRALYGYREFTDPREGFLLVRWLYVRAWMSDERPSHLFDLATARLLERKVLLPGATVLARLVVRIRERASRRLWSMLCALPSLEQIARLEALLIAPEGHRTSDFDRLRRGPTESADQH